MIEDILSILSDNPIIAAVKNDTEVDLCCKSDKKAVFVLYGSVNSIADIVKRLKSHDKTVFVYVDLLDGLSVSQAAVEFIKLNTDADGIISTKAPLIQRAGSLGLMTVFRTFMLDSMALKSLRKSFDSLNADFVEILPGNMPKIIKRLSDELNAPVIASGLISDKEDVISALSAGAVAVSSTSHAVWEL